MYRFLTLLFAVSTAVLAVMYAMKSNVGGEHKAEVETLKRQMLEQSAQLHTATSEQARLKTALAGADAASPTEALSRAEERIRELEQALGVAEQTVKAAEDFAESAHQNVLAVRDAEIDEADKEAGKEFMSGLSKMMDSPEMQEAVRAQLMNQMINPTYGTLFKELGLDPGTAESLRNLILDRQMVAVSQGMQAFDAIAGDPEKEADINAQIQSDQAAVEDQIRELLGDEQFQVYKRYQETEQERMVLGQFNQTLGYSGEGPLDPGLQEQLVEVMHAERMAESRNPSYVDMQNAGPSDFSEDTVTRFMQQQTAINGRVRDRARAFMSDDEFAAFERFQDNLLRQQEMGMRIGLRMFEGAKEEQKAK